MTQTHFTCTLTGADAKRRGCPRHAVAALDGITGAYVDWADSKGPWTSTLVLSFIRA
jgi:hypothetical protein